MTDRRTQQPWRDEARAGSVEQRRRRQAQHDEAAGKIIAACRSAGLSWRATAKELQASGIAPPRRARPTLGGEWQADGVARWHHHQARRIAFRLGIE